MNRKLMKFSALSALALSLVMWGCDSLSESALTGPGDLSENLIVKTNGDGYTTARETNPSVGVVSAVIDQNGGKLILGKHYLLVPAGAVSGPTTFTMTKPSDALKVELTATRLLGNDVGSAGFAVPVKLGMSYHDASDIPDPTLLKVRWAKLDGTFEIQPSVVDVHGKTVVGTLSHFSAYDIGFPNARETDETLLSY